MLFRSSGRAGTAGGRRASAPSRADAARSSTDGEAAPPSPCGLRLRATGPGDAPLAPRLFGPGACGAGRAGRGLFPTREPAWGRRVGRSKRGVDTNSLCRRLLPRPRSGCPQPDRPVAIGPRRPCRGPARIAHRPGPSRPDLRPAVTLHPLALRLAPSGDRTGRRATGASPFRSGGLRRGPRGARPFSDPRPGRAEGCPYQAIRSPLPSKRWSRSAGMVTLTLSCGVR